MRLCKLILTFLFCYTAVALPCAHAGDESILSSSSLFSTGLSKEHQMEFSILDQWKSTANVSETGARLLGLLNTTDASIQVNSHDADALYKRAYLYGLIGCPRLAVTDLSKAIEQDPEEAAFHRERGVCFGDLQDYSKALDDLDHALLLNPNSGDARLARARFLMAVGKPQLALADLLVCQRDGLQFEQVLPGELSANHYKAIDYYLGACYEALGRKHEALRHFLEAANAGSDVASTGAYVHRYADQPKDASVCIKRLQGF
ncbi:MAG: hypothetical protein K2W95_28505 [Candidatus Obscuribacterales bacterium]|nr:hypothetical protein [Candidatus Obscuribacterales bacterium]